MIAATVALLSVVTGAPELATVSNWNREAATHMNDGSYEEARRLYLRSLPVLERTLGAEHPSTVQTLANLCVATSHMSALLDAKPLCARALALREKVLGPNHPDVARSLSDLGILYANEGDLGRAESLLGRARRIADSLPGFEDAPALLNNLGFLYFKKKQYAVAAGLFERAIASVETRRGPEDPELVTMLTNLATVYRASHRAGAADEQFRKALAISEAAHRAR